MTDYANFLEQMQQSYEQLTGMRADDASDVGIRFKILAEQLSKIKEELEFAKQQSFPQTATGEDLEMHALERGIFRKKATCANGSIFPGVSCIGGYFDPKGCISDVFPDRGKSWNGYSLCYNQ